MQTRIDLIALQFAKRALVLIFGDDFSGGNYMVTLAKLNKRTARFLAKGLIALGCVYIGDAQFKITFLAEGVHGVEFYGVAIVNVGDNVAVFFSLAR